MSKGLMIALYGPSGGGKDSIEKALGYRRYPITITDRAPRKGEIDGFHYHFVSKELIKNLVDKFSIFAEWDIYNGDFKGEYSKDIKEANKLIDNGEILIRQLTYKGLVSFREKFFVDKVKSIFVYTTKEECCERMLLRGDDPFDVEKRLLTYSKELENMITSDLQVKNLNGQFDTIINQIKEAITLWTR